MILSAATLRKLKPVSPFNERFVVRGRSAGLSISGYDFRVAEDHLLAPGEFALGSSLEKFDLPKNVVGLIVDKSSWARVGLSVFNCCAEAGWRGHLTLELKNQSQAPLTILAGDSIAQMLFFQTDEITEGYNSKYQDQPATPVPAIYESPI